MIYEINLKHIIAVFDIIYIKCNKHLNIYKLRFLHFFKHKDYQSLDFWIWCTNKLKLSQKISTYMYNLCTFSLYQKAIYKSLHKGDCTINAMSSNLYEFLAQK